MQTIGKVVEKGGERYEWIIPEFLTFPWAANKCFTSPHFRFSGWYLEIESYGTIGDTRICIMLNRIYPERLGKSTRCTVGVKRANHFEETISTNTCNDFAYYLFKRSGRELTNGGWLFNDQLTVTCIFEELHASQGMDFDHSDDYEQVKTMTPKTPKRKQDQNDTRVSFQIPGKNSSENTSKSTVANKKQPTPTETGGFKEFLGMQAVKKNGKAKKAESENDDDDDQEDDEDADLGVLLGGDDDDDDLEDDEDADLGVLMMRIKAIFEEYADDDDEDEEDEQPKSKKQNAKQQNQSKKDSSEGQNKTPVKSSDKTPVKAKERTPLKQADKKKVPVKAEPESSKVASPKKTEKKDNPTNRSFTSRETQTDALDAKTNEANRSFTSRETQTDALDAKTNEGVSGLVKDVKELMSEDNDDYDVRILVKGQEFRAHKCILKTRSSVFRMMLTHDSQEKNSNEISIEDCDPDCFGEFMLFIYSGRAENLTPVKALHLYYAADKYDLPNLKEQCVRFMEISLCTTYVCDVVLLAAKHGEEELLQIATDFFVTKIKEILITVEWQNFMVVNPTVANELYIKSLVKLGH